MSNFQEIAILSISDEGLGDAESNERRLEKSKRTPGWPVVASNK